MQHVGVGSQILSAKAVIVLCEMPRQNDYSIIDTDDRFTKYLQLHRVENGVVCEGRPVKIEELRTLLKGINGGSSSCGVLSANMLSVDPGLSMWWYIPAGKRYISFAKRTGIASGEAQLPALLFGVDNHGLSVWALASDERPTEKTPVYHAPFFNVTQGSVCMGNVRVPEGVNIEDAVKWEKLFFRSVFTDEGDMQLSGIKPVDLWKSLTNGKLKKFPVKHLRKAGVLSTIIGR